MAKDKGRFTEGFDDLVNGSMRDLKERTDRRVENNEAYLTRKIDASFDGLEGKLLNNPYKERKALDNQAKADFTKTALDGVEKLSGTPAKNGKKAFQETDKLSQAPMGKHTSKIAGERIEGVLNPKPSSLRGI